VPSPAWAGRAAVAVLTAPVLRPVFACSSDGPWTSSSGAFTLISPGSSRDSRQVELRLVPASHQVAAVKVSRGVGVGWGLLGWGGVAAETWSGSAAIKSTSAGPFIGRGVGYSSSSEAGLWS
jgi:hypothetical protein